MHPINIKYISYLFILIIVIVIYISGCIYNNDEITVDLDKTIDGVVQYPADETDVIYFGFNLRLSPKEDARIYTPFVQYLSEETGRTFKIHFTPDNACTVDELGGGVTQFAALGGLGYINAYEKYDAIGLARGLNEECRGEYMAAIITQHDSDIYKIEDIRGRSFCFGTYYSTQGHLIPRKMLEDNNVLLSDIGEYTCSGSHVNTATAVISGEYDAAGVQDTLAQSLASDGLVRIVAYSDYYPSSVISANKDVDPELVEAVKKALLDFDPKGKHAHVLTEWDKTEMPCGFIEAQDDDYAQLRELAIRYDMIKQEGSE
jgi:phosphonate transport system substrate-binding protein